MRTSNAQGADSSAIEAFLRRAPYLHVYELGDLDPREAGHTTWIANDPIYSPALRVASLGDIATRPDARGRGHARRVTAALCRLLEPECDVIGLNVRADNAPAIACYRAVGFDARHAYDEWLVTAA
jgi:ribosomal protein S18 acetylase RimI-like enzyme